MVQRLWLKHVITLNTTSKLGLYFLGYSFVKQVQLYSQIGPVVHAVCGPSVIPKLRMSYEIGFPLTKCFSYTLWLFNIAIV